MRCIAEVEAGVVTAVAEARILALHFLLPLPRVSANKALDEIGTQTD